ncbi:MAG: sulfate ABC transporter substrate-binding protein [Helicobacteraceae bacterium]|jgi:sulfate transport system substrate-binding protein|nr:sulfate ABC transporter substrate-binding protein [Helicobacteraceae bacterium]
MGLTKPVIGLLTAFATASVLSAAQIQLLNVSYDPTRELYKAYNPAFIKYYKAKTGDDVTITQSHAGSAKQANAVIDGNPADVVTLALGGDIDAIAVKRPDLIGKDWIKNLPLNSSPYTSTIVFLVRKGNPKEIKDWDDLVKPGVAVITPNPKTSGGARWNYLAAWAYADRKYGGEDKAREFVKKLFANVPILDSGARGSTITFAQRDQGDVLLAWENEAFLIFEEYPDGHDKFEIVVPSLSILAEPSVTVVEGNVKKKGEATVKAAKEYLNFLYSKDGQRIAAKYYYRPTDKEVQKEFEKSFPTLKLVKIDDFGGWDKAQKLHFNDGGEFDKIYAKK